MNRELIVFGEDWGGHPSSTQHLISRLIEQYRVIWVNSIGLRRPRLCRRDLARMGQKLKQMLSAASPRPSNSSELQPQVVAPRVLPLPGSSTARQLNSYLLQKALLPLLNGRQDARPLLWTSLPSAVDVVGKLGEAATVYYCGDDFSTLEGVDHAPVVEMEQELADKADLILAASPTIAARFPQDKTTLLNHGVDYELFSSPTVKAADLPQSHAPVVGFYGSIAGWLDQDLILAAAKALPAWQFVFIGAPQVDTSAMATVRNIHLMGPRPHEALPRYVQHWDISILPFRNNAQIEACNPLKLREYMAAGTPIVSSNFPALRGYRDLIRIAETPESFVNALRHARTEPESFRSARQQRVAPESWQARANSVAELLNTL